MKLIYYYDMDRLPKVYLLGLIKESELQIFQRCKESCNFMRIIAQSDQQVLFEIFRSQDLQAVYSFMQLEERTIWYIAKEVGAAQSTMEGVI